MATGVLSRFWLASGLIALAAFQAALCVLTGRGTSPSLAAIFVWGGSLGDIALWLAILWRSAAARAAFCMGILSLGYLGDSLLRAPDLWADPLVPMVKVLAGIVLALWVCLFLEE